MEALLKKMRDYGLQAISRGGLVILDGQCYVRVDWQTANVICHHSDVRYCGNIRNQKVYSTFVARKSKWAGRGFRFAVEIEKGEA